MNILLINSEFPPIGGGAGNGSAALARQLGRLGHRVTVVTARFRNLPSVETQDGVTIFRIRSFRRRQDRSGALEQLAFIASASIWTLLYGRQFKPDATLAFFGMPSGAVAWVLKRVFRIPYIVSLRGGDVPGFRPYDFALLHKMIGPFLRIIWRDASAVIANSRGLRDLALAFDPSTVVTVIPNGVDSAEYCGRAREWTPACIMSVGRVVHQKGFDLAIRALAQTKDLDWHWRIAGSGPQMEAVQALARNLGISDRVTFLGWQAREEVRKWNHQANLFLFPSRHEGMPNAVLEAMADGLPVVATRIAGNEELVVDGENGLLVESENVDQLRDAIRKLISDPALGARMGVASQQRVEQHYTWASSAKSYQTILQQVTHLT
jgi:glycosyltransferase involved in cell wall biosynthesis